MFHFALCFDFSFYDPCWICRNATIIVALSLENVPCSMIPVSLQMTYKALLSHAVKERQLKEVLQALERVLKELK